MTMTTAMLAALLATAVDFNAPGTLGKVNEAWRVSADGRTMSCAPTNGVRAFEVNVRDVGEKPFRVRFDVRLFETVIPAHHWGLGFTAASGNRFFTWAQDGIGFIHKVTTPKGVQLAGGSGGEPVKARGKSGEDVAWTPVELDCAADSYVMRLGRCVSYQGELPLLGPRRITFHAYNESVEIRNLVIEPLPKARTDATPKPTFRTKGGAKGSWGVTNAVNALVGGVTCWMRPEPRTDMLCFLRADGSPVAQFSAYSWDWPRAAIWTHRRDVAPIAFTRRVPNITFRTGEWFHFAFTWDEKAHGRFFINGLPFSPGSTGGERIGLSLLGNALDEVARIAIADDNVRDVTVWRRTLTGREVMEDYRRAMPLDCVMSESLVPAGRPVPPVFRLAPGGTYLRPNPVEALKRIPAKATVSSRIERIIPLHENRRFPDHLTGYRFEPVPGGETAPREYDVKGPVDVAAASVPLEEGRYRLSISVNGFTRNHLFTAAKLPDLSAKPEVKDGLARGACVWEKSFGTPYRETDGRKDSRFFEVVAFPERMLEKPCLLEIDWPDDKPRAMGFYMYEEARNSSREHLQQGLIAGAEVPSSGRRQTAKYLFYPATTNYLFEVRTLIPNRPAAVAALRVYELPEGLPVLRIHRPEGMKGRTFGHCDEDQTFDNLLTSALMGRPTAQVLGRLCEYLRYTGQNAFHYSVMRYATMNYGWVEGAGGGGVFPRAQGELREMARTLRRNGIEFVPQNMYANDPAIARFRDIEGRDLEGNRLLRDNDGLLRPYRSFGKAPMNHTNPDEVKRFLGLFADVFRDLSTNGVDRTLMCLGNEIASPLAWRSWDYGTTNAPNGLAARCAPVTENVRRYVRAVSAANPDLRVTVEVPADAETRAMRGVDLRAVAAVPNVDLAIIRWPTAYWQELFRIGSPGTSRALEKAYGPKAVDDLRELRKAAGGAVPVVYSYPAYYESFTKLPDDPAFKRFGNYFQDIDARPWGRHFLREPAFCLAETDMLNYAIGMEPLGSWGADDEVREFTQAYCALPAKPFSGFLKENGVVGRGLRTENGTYFYFVNTTSEDRRVKAPVRRYLDLSTDTILSDAEIALRPYELRSFRSLK